MKKILTLTFSLAIFSNTFAQNGIPGACGSGGKNPLPLDGSAFLGQTYNQSACGLNYVQASKLIEKRFDAYTTAGNIGSGLPTTLSITGLPSCVTILKAYVWYLVSYLGGSPQASSVVITNPVPATTTYAATNIGQDQDKCWGETGTVNYRADVTAAISGNGNYGINITGITGSGGNFPNWYDQIDGLTLFIIYQDNGASYQGSLVIWDGDMTGVGNNYTQTMTGINACGNSTAGNAFLIVSDMQDNVNGNQHPSTLNGNTANYPNNFYNFDVVNTAVTAGQATSAFGTDGLSSDCFDWAVMGLYYQTTTCTTCTPSAVSLTVTPTPSTCNAPNGGATATATTSNPPLTYLWSPGGQTTTSISNLAAGTYTCTVTSATGCSTVQTFTITTSVGPNVTFTSTSVLCNGGSTGSATLTASGGTAPYTYGWITIPVQTSPTATGLAAGTYSVSVSDASGCSATYTVAVTQPTALTATTSSTPTSCTANNGTATASGSGGTAPYTYAWATTPVQASPTATGFGAGTYSVVVTDANGCSATFTVAVTTQGSTLTATASVINNALCFGTSDGSAIANPVGGTGPYSYNWNPTGQNTQTASGLAAGTYSVVVTDANGCTTPQSVNITQPAAVTLSNTTVAASCGVADGSATATAAGGTAPYSYMWLTSPIQTTPTLNNVAGGVYTIIVTDANGCTQQMSVTIAGGAPPTAAFSNNPDTVSLLDATIYFSDLSTSAFTWFWDFGDPNDPTASSQQNPLHTYSDTGIYCITLIVTDPGGACKDTTIHCIKVEAPFTFYAPNAFTPNSDGFNQFFFGKGTYIKDYKMWIFDRWGNQIWSCHTFGEPQIDTKCLWDGKVKRNGDIVQEDVYVWKVEIIDSNSKPHKYIGHVTVVQ